jgi:hypothetical protein
MDDLFLGSNMRISGQSAKANVFLSMRRFQESTEVNLRNVPAFDRYGGSIDQANRRTGASSIFIRCHGQGSDDETFRGCDARCEGKFEFYGFIYTFCNCSFV